MTEQRPILYFATLYAASAGALKVAGLVFFVFVARTLPVDDYAQWGLLYALQTGVTMFGIAGIVESVIGLLALDRSIEKEQGLFAAANTVFLLSSGIVFCIAVLAGVLMRSGATLATVVAVVASGVLLGFCSLQAQVVRLEEKHLSSLCFNFFVPLAGLLGSCLAFALDQTVASFFWGSTIGLSIALAAVFLSGLGFYRKAVARTQWVPIVSRLGPYLVLSVLGWLSGYGNNYVIQFLLDPLEVAKFTFALTLSAIIQLVATAMNQVWNPRFYRLLNQLPVPEVERQSRRFFGLQAVVLGLIGAVLIAALPLATQFLGGNLAYYQSARTGLLFLVLYYLASIPWWHCNNYFMAHDQGPAIMRVALIAGVAGLAASILLIIVLGPIGIYAGLLLQIALRSAGLLIAAKRNWSVKMSWEGIAAGIFLTLAGFAATTN